MKKYLISLIILIILIPLTVNAVRFENPLRSNNFWCMVNGIIDFVFNASLALAAIMYIVAGYFFATSLGQAEKITTAKKIMIWTTIGLLLVFLAKGIIVLVLRIFNQSTDVFNC